MHAALHLGVLAEAVHDPEDGGRGGLVPRAQEGRDVVADVVRGQALALGALVALVRRATALVGPGVVRRGFRRPCRCAAVFGCRQQYVEDVVDLLCSCRG